MTHLSSQTTLISFRIWILSVLFITTVCVIIFSGFTSEAILFLLFGLFVGSVISLPFFVFLIMVFTNILSKNLSWYKTVRKLFFAVFIISVAASILFYFIVEPIINEVLESFILVLISGLIAVYSQIGPIKTICEKRDNEYTIDEQSSIRKSINLN